MSAREQKKLDQDVAPWACNEDNALRLWDISEQLLA